MSKETILFNVISPDGFTISFEGFTSRNQAKKFFKRWLKQFKKIGYYSSVNGRILYEDLKSSCTIVKDVFVYYDTTFDFQVD